MSAELASVLAALVTTVGVIASAGLAALPKLKELNGTMKDAAQDAKVARAQTENHHAGHEFPNLRDQLDAIHEDSRWVRRELEGVREDVRDVREDVRDVSDRLSSHIADSAPESGFVRVLMDRIPNALSKGDAA